MTPISAEVGTSMLNSVGQVGNYIMTSFGNLSGVLLAVAGIGVVLGLLYNAVSLRR